MNGSGALNVRGSGRHDPAHGEPVEGRRQQRVCLSSARRILGADRIPLRNPGALTARQKELRLPRSGCGKNPHRWKSRKAEERALPATCSYFTARLPNQGSKLKQDTAVDRQSSLLSVVAAQAGPKT